MKIQLTADELKELLERKDVSPSWAEWLDHVDSVRKEVEANAVHKLGDPRKFCDDHHGADARIWNCTLPLGHTGTHAACPTADAEGKPVTWENKP